MIWVYAAFVFAIEAKFVTARAAATTPNKSSSFPAFNFVAVVFWGGVLLDDLKNFSALWLKARPVTPLSKVAMIKTDKIVNGRGVANTVR